ncbi:hypothetical protein [Halobaculum rubrum]|uniref:hypothetical protein n=1 Tax=Halobaculum rubrum TaxID=2872158 RepID=UPI001CA3B097|nr:hypothetical protein [Halobaculum rubrum]QZX98619.1 hypothetical protein K6T25_10050 [Halobaculum rubrum]
MTDRRRDALLALAATVTLLLTAPLLGLELARLTGAASLAAAVVGAAGALGIELTMARRPSAARRLWADRRVRWGGTLLVALGGPAAVAVDGGGVGPLVVAALLGGLIAYFLLLAGVCSGVLAPPETWFTDRP